MQQAHRIHQDKLELLRTRGKDYKSDWGSSSSPISFEVKVITKTSAHPYTGVVSSNAYTIDGVEGAVLNFDRDWETI